MKIKKIGFTLCCLFLIVFLVFVMIGLNITGPMRLSHAEDAHAYETVKKRFPLVTDFYRHAFQYVTYSGISKDEVLIFDYEGMLVMRKDYDESKINAVKNQVKEDYGIDAEVHIGYGYNNVVFVVEEDHFMVYYDYDTLEIVYYFRGDLI